MEDLKKQSVSKNEIVMNTTPVNRLEVIEERIRKKYLSRLSELQVLPADNLLPIDDDLIENIRLFKISEMIYQKGEYATDKFTTVFNTLSTYNASVFVLIDSDGKRTDFYLGVRNNELDENEKKSTVTIIDTLKNTLIGNFPGVKTEDKSRIDIKEITDRIQSQDNVASVSVVGNNKIDKLQSNEQFVQGLEKLAMAMQGKQYIGIILAESRSSRDIHILRRDLQDLYTKLTPLQKLQVSSTSTSSVSRSKNFSEMSRIQKAGVVGNIFGPLVGASIGTILSPGVGTAVGAVAGNMVLGKISGIVNLIAPTEQLSESITSSSSTNIENKMITDLLQLIDEGIKRTNEFDSYGMWDVASYFLSEDMSSAEIAASNYLSLMNGENSGRETSAINSWKISESDNYAYFTKYLSRFMHPQLVYGNTDSVYVLTDATTNVSGKELGLHLGLPRATVSGLPVLEHADFGKDVIPYSLDDVSQNRDPKNRMTLGKIFDLGRTTEQIVELDNSSLNMHTFITGSTGSGKSNTVYQMLSELHQDRIPFLVIEPAKGEYKDVFGNMPDVNVFSTNPKIAPLININPFMFPESIHVLEHVDGLVEIFSVCWPMYDAMPAFFKDAILKSYEYVGWDLGSSTFEGDDVEYPDFEIIANQLEKLIGETDYSAEVKGNYTGALVTRVKSLTVGLNRFIFTSNQTPYEDLFDKNCILDISRVKSIETKALLMGLTVYALNEYREDTKHGNNSDLKHVTVLEEAHNLLKNTSGGESDLVGKSVEMITNTIAEIRTYGEGFIIVDQSPSSVDIAAIKNTNTKIVLRTPEANDREAIGRSVGLNSDQVNEIAKLPKGVAVVYQNNWVSPVLTRISKANVVEEAYVNKNPSYIMSARQAREDIIRIIMEPWLPGEKIEFEEAASALNSLELSRNNRKLLSVMICAYRNHNGHMLWDEGSLGVLKVILFDVLDITDAKYNSIIQSGNPDELRKYVGTKTNDFSIDEIDEICNVLTMEVMQ